MKRIRAYKHRIVFQLGRQEAKLLLALLARYPLLPEEHQPLSKSGPARDDETNQELLNEALAEQRRENKSFLQALLQDPQRLRPGENGFHLSLSAVEIEQFLQILNDIRVGSWVRLGSPEEKDGWKLRVDEVTAPHAWMMEMAGYFQMSLLDEQGPRRKK